MYVQPEIIVTRADLYKTALLLLPLNQNSKTRKSERTLNEKH